MRIAINGLGRIGRQTLRQLQACPELDLVAVNDLADPASLAQLIKHDSVHGRAGFPVSHGPGHLLLAGRSVPVFQEPDPARVPFGAQGATLVLDCTGRHTARADAARHLHDGVTRVLISAPSADADFTAIPGVNTCAPGFAAAQVLSAACPASHALALLVQVLDAAFGVEHGLALVMESYRNDQRILDLPHPDLRMARAAAMSMIPCPSQAGLCLGQALPAMAGRVQAQAIRVPTPDVSLLDLSLSLSRDASAEAVHAAFRAAQATLPGLLDYLDEPLVSVDLRGETASCVLDPFLTRIMAPRFIKVFAWHDNEVAYSARLLDLCRALAGGKP